MKANRTGSFVVLLTAGAIGGAVLVQLRPTRPAFVDVQGSVYASLDPQRGAISPVSGAIVFSDSDQTTAVTDQAGRFSIRVRRVAADEFVQLRATVDHQSACGKFAGGNWMGSTPSALLFLDGGHFGTQKCRQP